MQTVAGAVRTAKAGARRRARAALAAVPAAVALLATGAAGPAPAVAAAGEGPDVVAREAHFVPPENAEPDDGLTYDPTLVPAGAGITVVEVARDGRTSVRMGLSGLLPNRTYGAHVHTKPCGPDPAAAGPHYQNEADPVQPSVDPAYANPENEVWLDFTTDRLGNAYTSARQDWRFRPGEARSVVVHEHATMTHPGGAGMAGARLACLSVPFE
ncbi:superoxide dismutase family protein [Streptomyces sp. WMMC500]|uniref:superoxide dismutase family protein n=1 Tax=Streptomyces sp. WMMC500 TaxID=3015154 RepID=UPI00248BC491|nr:superoxide dismutase family protein [Streptomyces sp. WMMC500]WBB60956.1 superoxide dismutase family protein [Streptomyces sp. WMMC500]